MKTQKDWDRFEQSLVQRLRQVDDSDQRKPWIFFDASGQKHMFPRVKASDLVQLYQSKPTVKLTRTRRWASKAPVLIERPITTSKGFGSRHEDGKLRVLYLDGHVEARRIDSCFATSTPFLKALMGAEEKAKGAGE